MAALATDDEKRVAFARTLLEEDLKLKVSSIEPLGRAFNNYAFTATVSLDVKSPNATLALKHLQPGTKSIPTDITKVVVRMGNPAAALNESVRVQNEVAAIQLCSEACSAYPRKVIPDVYGWSNKSTDDGYGWIVEELMPGEPLLPAFAALSADAQQGLLNEMASIYKCITGYKLPASIKGFGGLGYNEKADVVVGPIVFDFGGPWDSYDEMYEKTMDKQLSLADGSPLFNGWRKNGLRERLELFRAEGMGKILAQVSDKTPTLIHGDFDLINMMFDPETNTITALLDFDLAHIAGPADELFYSFAEIHGLMGSSLFVEEGCDETKLWLFLVGDSDLPMPELLPTPQAGKADTPAEAAKVEERKVDWAVAAKWDAALLTAKATRPRDIDGLADLASLYWFIQDVCSPFMLMPRFFGRFTEEEKAEKIAATEKRLVRCLEYWGY